MIVLQFSVPGVPAPKGSMRSFWSPRSRRVVTKHDNPRTEGWQLAVTAAAIKARGHQATIGGAVNVTLTFYLPKPKRETGAWPIKKRADIDKLARAVLDALTKARVYLDDSQVVLLGVRKEWDSEAGGTSGVRVEVRELWSGRVESRPEVA